MKKVYICAFEPLHDKSAVGGFDWYYEKSDASARMVELIGEDHGQHSLHYVESEFDVENADQRTIELLIEDFLVNHVF